jgi:hypothetical protein
VEAEMKTYQPTIARRNTHFEKARIAGLEGQHKGGRPRKPCRPGS